MRGGTKVRSALVLLATLATVLIVSTGVRAYAAEAFVVPSGSMLPTLQIGDHLVVDKLSSTVHRGDIVVFRRAPGDHDTEYADLVKRVIGLPGDTIPPGQYFVMGDCRGDSSDSRVWGTVPASNIIGKVTVVVWRHNHPWVHWF